MNLIHDTNNNSLQNLLTRYVRNDIINKFSSKLILILEILIINNDLQNKMIQILLVV